MNIFCRMIIGSGKLVFGFALFLPCINVLAGLQWEALTVDKKADPLGDTAEVVYHFVNSGQVPVTITSVKPACGCTATDLAKKTYAPSEKGKLVARLSLADRQGLQSKTVTITTDDGAEPVVLTLNVEIPVILEIMPVFVYWQRNEAPEPKIVTLKVGVDDPVRVLRAESDNRNISADLEPLGDGKSYKLTVFPATTADLLKARIALSVEYPVGKPRTYYVYAHVK